MDFDKRKILTSSFNALKDNWSTKKDAIRKCIAQMVSIDAYEAVDMWLYIARRYDGLNLLKEESEQLFNWTLYRLRQELNDEERMHLAIALYKNKDFCDYMYKLNYCIGDEESHFIKWLFFIDMPKELLYVLNNIASNHNNNEYTLGRVIFEAISEYKKIKPCHELRDETKKAIAEFIENIEDESEKSEAYVALLDII